MKLGLDNYLSISESMYWDESSNIKDDSAIVNWFKKALLPKIYMCYLDHSWLVQHSMT